MDFESLYKYIFYTVGDIDDIKKEMPYFENRIESHYKVLAPKLKSIGYDFKNYCEVVSFVKFTEYLISNNISPTDIAYYTNYFVFGYKIPQIGKEFDLIRFGENYNINIELKSESTDEKQKIQLKKNHFYLNFLNKNTRYFSFSSNNS